MASTQPPPEGPYSPSTANLIAHRGEFPHLSHGLCLARGLLMRCDRCLARKDCDRFEKGGECALEREFIAGRLAELEALPNMAPVHLPAVVNLLWVEVRQGRIYRAMNATGEIVRANGKLDASPLAAEANRLASQWRIYAQNLGLSMAQVRASTQEAQSTWGSLVAAQSRGDAK